MLVFSNKQVWASTVREVKKVSPETTIETLIPDFRAKWDWLYHMLESKPEVVSHNMETVEELYRLVRPQAKYSRSLEQIKRTSEFGLRTKSGAMLGCGEHDDQIKKLMHDLLEHQCDILTLGQYLQPTKMHLPVSEYVHPDKFKYWEEYGLELGFKYVESGPMVRSSYHAEKHVF